MMQASEILNLLNGRYPMRFDSLEFVRDSGSVAYTAVSSKGKYFLRMVKPAFFDTASRSADIHAFLQTQGFPVPPIIFTKENEPCFSAGDEAERYLFILYEFMEGGEANPETDAEDIGALIGRLHRVMRDYPASLVQRDKHFFIGRYVDILRQKQYPKAAEFEYLGDALWDKVKDLPRGYCHGDMYRGNILKTPGGGLYVLDFDTSCDGFPIYDPVLICNITDYFKFFKSGYGKSKKVFERFLPEYEKHNPLSRREKDAFFDLIAVYHYQVQATVMEIHGVDCVDNEFLDKQLEWLRRWLDQCDQSIPLNRMGINYNSGVM